MNRLDVIKSIMDNLTDELVVSSCGWVSRDVYAVKDRAENFYMMGSMGATVGFSIGLSLNIKRKVIVIAGDGDILMSLGTLALTKKLKLDNLAIYILDNNKYQSTGGQETCSDVVDFDSIGYNCNTIKVEDVGPSPRIDIPHKKIAKRFYNAVNGI